MEISKPMLLASLIRMSKFETKSGSPPAKFSLILLYLWLNALYILQKLFALWQRIRYNRTITLFVLSDKAVLAREIAPLCDMPVDDYVVQIHLSSFVFFRQENNIYV